MDKRRDSKPGDNHATGSRPVNTGSNSFKADDEVANLCAIFEQLNLPSKPTKFVINTIAYVPECDSSSCNEESSDEENDRTFSHRDFNFDVENRASYPFTSKSPNSINLNLTDEIFSSLNENDSTISKVVEPFLFKIADNSFEDDEKNYLKSHVSAVSASIGLNRMKSLSTRKNNSLMLELQSKVNNVAEIRYKIFGIFWKCQWYDKNGKTVDQIYVTKFYKQLKRIDRQKAQKFRESEEVNIDVPYQQLREYLKNHENTKKLVQEFRRENAEANIYISLIDADTVDFNGVYSAYWRIINELNFAPTVMSTGYEYSEGEPAFQTASHIDRMLRVKTAEHIPLGVYYPEPNTCILIKEGFDTLQESFIDMRREKCDLESSCILRKIKNRPDAVFVFSSDNPLITTIPERANTTKNGRNSTVSTIPFSPEFIQGASPTKTDFKSLKQVAQSSFREYIWYSNIFINKAMRFVENDKKYKIQRS